MIRLGRQIAFLVGTLFGLSFAAPAVAAEMMKKPGGFPQRPITMIVPYGAGGGSDQLSRAMTSGRRAHHRRWYSGG